MLKKTKHRLLLIISCILSAAIGIYIILYNLEQNITFFYPPSKIPPTIINQEIRIGGLVKTINKQKSGETTFVLTDNVREIQVFYQGVLPALFRENQGIVAQGKLSGTTFIANELLTKHDENYMPPSEYDLIRSKNNE